MVYGQPFAPVLPLPPTAAFGGKSRGRVLSYDQSKGYGFLHCPALGNEDVYFQRRELNLQARELSNLKGKNADFEVQMTPDGKARAINIRIFGGDREKNDRNDRDEPEGAPLQPLDADSLEKMLSYLEERGGYMDLSKFSREFKAVKKSQLEEHFEFIPEDASRGGRWHIAIPGVEIPQASREDAVRNFASEKTARNDDSVGHFVGVIHNYDSNKGYGFLRSEEMSADADVYFKKPSLPVDARGLGRNSLIGSKVFFEGLVTPDGKPRAENIEIIEKPSAAQGDGLTDSSDAPELLTLDRIQDMKAYLDEHDGAMDYGKFANMFPGVKKAQILQQNDDFVLVQQGDNAGGRWLITLPGVNPDLVPLEDKGTDGCSDETAVEPGPNLLLIGCVKRWDARKNFGFLLADGADDVFIHRTDLPPEIHDIRNLVGAEIAFELSFTEDGKPKAVNAKPIIQPSADGATWQLRRSP